MWTKFKNFLFSRYTLIAVLCIILAAVIWFFGPLLTLGSLTPLETSFARFLLITWLLCIMLFIALQWPVSPLVFALVLVLFWFFSPFVGTVKYKPFESELARWVAVTLAILAYLLFVAVRFIQKIKKNPMILDKYLAKGKKDAEKQFPHANEINTRLTQAIRHLKKLTRYQSFFKRFLTPKDAHLYRLPWYMVIGDTGSGKSTMIANSRLTLPVAEQHSLSAIYTKLGTDHPSTQLPNFWLTNDAVLVDLPGKYLRAPDDSSERNDWLGLLKLLKSNRPKHGVNGLVITVNTADLLRYDDSEANALAADIRVKLLEVRRELGIVCPVYITLTKLDTLPGFKAYFKSLTIESRDQVLGFTLDDQSYSSEELKTAIKHELGQLSERIRNGLVNRLNEELNLEERQTLFIFPEEFLHLTQRVQRLVQTIFGESRFEEKHDYDSLRGVYFTSAAQSDEQVSANLSSLLRKFKAQNKSEKKSETDARAQWVEPTTHQAMISENRSYFIRDVFSSVIFGEASLVKPNGVWLARKRLLTISSYAVLGIVAFWMSLGLYGSMTANHEYLDNMAEKTEHLRHAVLDFARHPNATYVSEILSDTKKLPELHGWDLNRPTVDVRYGLYTPPRIQEASANLYQQLNDRFLLMGLVRRIEQVMQTALLEQDPSRASGALNVYLMLHASDPAQFDARAVKDWVLQDWSKFDGAQQFGNSAGLVSHIEELFDGSRVVKASTLANHFLIDDTRRLLAKESSIRRLYDNVVFNVKRTAPPDFTLTRVLGPQAGLVFMRPSGASVDKGIPGIYTYDGYHKYFNPQLRILALQALTKDRWLMGETTLDETNDTGVNQLVDDIRRQYLTDYAHQWQTFLDDIDIVNGQSIAFNLTILRDLASPNSPMTRLAKSVVHETTLSQNLNGQNTNNDDSLFSSAKLDGAKQVLDKGLGFVFREEAATEKEIVDNRFGALREMVIGQADASPQNENNLGMGNSGIGISINLFSSLVNEYYNYLSMTDTALKTGSLPKPSELDLRIKLEADKMAAPFGRVLHSMVDANTMQIDLTISELLNTYAQRQFSDMMTTLDSQVTGVCVSSIEGRYPFELSNYEVTHNDFSRVFGAEGVLDSFFTNKLKNYVNTNQRPWRYWTIDQYFNNQLRDKEGASGTMNLVAPQATIDSELLKILIEHGPDPENFARGADIRQAFFQEPGQKRLSVDVTYQILEVDPKITTLTLDFDGNINYHFHGPTRPVQFKWPGEKGGQVVFLSAEPKIDLTTSIIRKEGSWALFRLLEQGVLIDTAMPERSVFRYDFDRRQTLFEFKSESAVSPFNLDQFRRFQCPRAT